MQVTMQIVLSVVLLLLVAAAFSKEYCSGEGEIKCDDTTTCEETHYRDIRRSPVGCCQRCVKKLLADQECSEEELGQETLPSARCQAGLMCMEGRCKEFSNVVEAPEAVSV